MDRALMYAVGRANPCTGNPVCLTLAGALIREGERRGCRGEVVAEVMRRRRERLRWLTLTQRKWQARTRRQSRARHHDSVQIRERWVRLEA